MHLRVGVVGDGDPACAHERRRRPRAEVRLPRLEPRAAVVLLAPGDHRLAHRARGEAVQGVIGDDEHAPRLVDRERIADRLAGEAHRLHGAAVGVDGADERVHGDEPEEPAPVGQARDDPLGRLDDGGEIVHAHQLEGGPERRGRLAHHPDLVAVGRDDGAVLVVEVEVAAAREVAEHAAAPRRARRERKDGEQVERRRVEHREPRPLEADADGDDPAGGVEGERCALGVLLRRENLGAAAERPAAHVGVGLVGVVVDVAASVGRHEGVLGNDGCGHRARRGGRADEGGDGRGEGIVRDGRGARGGGEREHAGEGGSRAQHVRYRVGPGHDPQSLGSVISREGIEEARGPCYSRGVFRLTRPSAAAHSGFPWDDSPLRRR